MRHQRMANVQLVDPLDCRYRFHVVVVQAMAGIDDQPLSQTKRHTLCHTLQLLSYFGRGLRVSIAAGVQFDSRCTYAP